MSNPELLEALRQRGAEVFPVPIYRWALPEDTGPLKKVLGEIIAGNIAGDAGHQCRPDRSCHAVTRTGRHRSRSSKRPAKRWSSHPSAPTASERLRHYDLPIDFEPSHSKMGVLVKEASEQVHAPHLKTQLAQLRSAVESTCVMGNWRRIGEVSMHSFIRHAIGCAGLNAASAEGGSFRFRRGHRILNPLGNSKGFRPPNPQVASDSPEATCAPAPLPQAATSHGAEVVGRHRVPCSRPLDQLREDQHAGSRIASGFQLLQRTIGIG